MHSIVGAGLGANGGTTVDVERRTVIEKTVTEEGSLVIAVGLRSINSLGPVGAESGSQSIAVAARNHYMVAGTVLALVCGDLRKDWTSPENTPDVGSSWRVTAVGSRNDRWAALKVEVEPLAAFDLIAFGRTLRSIV
jgi:hypothetical protein